ncbi:MAG: hypothetical protein LBL15_02650, partial [Oscillospiraceae bacterium]|nr:hypothetical protein [Oscillospiraceae bacterium]
GLDAELIKLNLINPLDTETVLCSLRKTGRLLIAEEVCAAGSVGSRLLAACSEAGVSLANAKALDLGRGIVAHGGVEELIKLAGLDAESIAAQARAFFVGGAEAPAAGNAV